MSYEDERQRILRERMNREGRYLTTTFDAAIHHEGIPVGPSAYSELEQMQAAVHQDDYLTAAGFVPGVIHDRRGVYEGIDARAIAQRTSMVGLARSSGFNRGTNVTGENIIDNPLGADDNVRVYDKNPIPPGEYFVRPLSMQFDRIAMESFLSVATTGFPFFCEYRNKSTIASGAIWRVPDTVVTGTYPGTQGPTLNHDHPVEQIVVINDSDNDIIVGVDKVPSDANGAPGAGGSGDFLLKGGETGSYPVRCYSYVQIFNDGGDSIAANDIRLQMYGYKDSHSLVLLRGFGRTDGLSSNNVASGDVTNASPVMP